MTCGCALKWRCPCDAPPHPPAGIALLLYFSQTFNPPAAPSEPGEAEARAYNNALAGVWAIVCAFLGAQRRKHVMHAMFVQRQRCNGGAWRLIM